MRCCASIYLQAVALASFLIRGNCFSVSFFEGSTLGCSKRNQLRPLFETTGKSLTASEKERRDEEKRQRERAEDVVIGKTSAVSGASDYALDVVGTQEKWMRQASSLEQEIARMTDLGMEMMRMLRLHEAAEAFDRVFVLKPDAYLWQAGIVRYYLGDWDGAANIFSRCATIYELRFGEPASEERIWRNACLLKKLSSMNRSERKTAEESDNLNSLVAVITENEKTSLLLQSERRRVLRLSLILFEAEIRRDFVNVIITRAKLRSTAGLHGVSAKMDKKLWNISSLYYLALHADAKDDNKESKHNIKLALKLCPNANSVDLMHTLPLLHMTCRNWFDDDDFDDQPIALPKDFFGLRDAVPSTLNPILAESIRCSIDKLRLADVQSALRSRGLRTMGSKEEAQARLFLSLLDDPDLIS